MNIRVKSAPSWVIALLLFIISMCASPAAAIEHVFDYVPQGTSCSWTSDEIQASRIQARFNTVTKRFRWSVTFAPPASPFPIALPSLYYIVINDGPMPRGQPGSLAIFYFDASNPASPILTVYGYSGENNGQSYRDGSQAAGTQAPDRILSSVLSQNWINELSVTNTPNGGQIFSFDIDATSILNHSPLYPDPGAPWFGTGFSEHVGLWFHMFRNVSIGYINDQNSPGYGYIDYFYGYEDCYDLENLTTVVDQPPVCDPGASTYMNACEGLLTTIPLDGSASFDPENLPLTYHWSTNCANGSVNPDNTAQTVLTLSQPGAGQAQACSATLTVSDGPNEVACAANVEVPACTLDCLGQPNGDATLDLCGVCNGNNSCVDCAGTPFGTLVVDRCGVCGGDGQSCLGCTEVNIASTQLAMDSNTSSLRSLVYRATRRLLSIRKSKKDKQFVQRVRKDADKLHIAGWTLTFQTPSNVISCTNDVFCTSASLQTNISSFNQTSEQLKDLVNEVVTRISDIRGSITEGDRHTKRSAKKIHQNNLEASATLPQSISACS